MKLMLVSWLLALTGFLGPEEHDLSMAVFRISASESGLQLQINFDREDYGQVNEITLEEINLAQLQGYLDETTSWTINGKKLDVQVEQLQLEDNHIVAICTIASSDMSISTIKVENEFLLPIDDQSNIIMLELNGKSRGFRMHSGRKEIEVNY